MKSKFIGDRKFYKMVLLIAVPIMIQNGITNFVSLLDNIMVGQVGTDSMSGVAIVNQLIFVFNLCIFGAISGIGIFGAQYYGNDDQEGFRQTFRFKIIVCTVIFLASLGIFLIFGEDLISLFLHEGGETGNIADTLLYGKDYLMIMLIGLLPFAIMQAYASTLREKGETLLPMKAGITAVLINLVFNYILIFGNFGAPKLGVNGAAIATVISRFAECFIVVAWTHINKDKNQFIINAYSKFHIKGRLIKSIFIKGTPLLLNEVLWAAGMTIVSQCYSLRGLAVVAGNNIASTISNVFSVVFLALGSSIAIVIGQLLGAGKMKEAKEQDTKMIFFSVACCSVMALIMLIIAPIFPRLYNTTDEVMGLASSFIRIMALVMPLGAFNHACYFTLRSGGKTIVTFIFDSMFVWIVSIPVAFILSRYTPLGIIPIYTICQFLEIIKCFIGYKLVKSNVWIQNII